MEEKRKHHKKKKVGKKAKKKKISKNVIHNKKYHKAYAFSGGINSAHRRKQHLFELEEKKLRVPKHFKEGSKNSPLIVAIQGAKGVGKSTLLKSLLKHYVGITVNEVNNGPISIFTKNGRRYTFIETKDDILAMIDVAKIADICLLVIDGNFGFELETLEFISILNTHGMPKVLGVVTNLDKFKDSKSIRKRKKKLTKRFAEELVEGSKIFFLSGIQNNRYNKTEIRNLCKFLSVVKKPLISWRDQHGYMLALRVDVEEAKEKEFSYSSDIVSNSSTSNAASTTNGRGKEDKNTDLTNFLANANKHMTVYIEGYVYGSKIYKNQTIHIPNMGDVKIENIQVLQDPFKYDEQKKKTNIYAPMSDIGNVVFDFDNMYIHIPKNKINFTRRELLMGGEEKEEEGEEEEEEGKEGDVGDYSDSGSDDGSDDGSYDGSDDGSEEGGVSSRVKVGSSEGKEPYAKVGKKNKAHTKGTNQKYMTESIKMIRDLQNSKYIFSKHSEEGDKLILFDDRNDEETRGVVDVRRKAPSNVFVSEKQKKKKLADDYVNEKAEEYNKLKHILFEKKNKDEDDYYYAEGVSISSDDEKKYGDGWKYEADKSYKDGGRNEEDKNYKDCGKYKDDKNYNDGKQDEKFSNFYRTYGLKCDIGEEESASAFPDQGTGEDTSTNNRSDANGVMEKERKVCTPIETTMDLRYYSEDYKIAEILAFDNKVNIDSFVYDYKYINRKNSYLYYKGDIINILKEEKRKVHDEILPGDQINRYMYKTLLSTDIVQDNNVNRKYSYMNEDNYYYNYQDTFKCTTDNIFIFNNLTVSLVDIADHALVENFFFIYGSVYSMYFGRGEHSDGDKGGELDGEFSGEVNGEVDGGVDGEIDGKLNEDEDDPIADRLSHLSPEKSWKRVKAERELQMEKYKETEEVGALSNAYGSAANIGEYGRIEIRIEKSKLGILKNGLIICGGLQSYEEKDSYVHCRIKKHRWFPKLLRSNDPLIFSVGWRKFQSIPTYSINERNNVRIRYLKYTTEHMHCNCTFYGPLAGVNSGILALYNYKKTPFYRICINGVIIETNNNINIMKKLKLIGEPYKIYKNTAFIKNMFNSDLEVCKFINCPVVTPSGIKGLIKNKLDDKGNFRCTFADKIRISDIVILKLYVNVKIKKYYNYDIENKLRSINELRYIYNIYVNHTSGNYRKTPFRHFYHSKIHINPKLLKELPYKTKPKLFKKVQHSNQINKKKEQQKDQINFHALENPKLAARWYQMLHTIKKNMIEKKKEKSKLAYHNKLKNKLKMEQEKQKVIKSRKKLSYKKSRKP
ncbi:small ribosomal subunit assembling AARP2 protein, putative [Plasmodium malariae]|uniref:Small ribosomal subunit assembling AARP2 protein, putative n=1 Tax=Plasmodium malariae TaxID=5858 RepID=A0A1D3JKP0_PLAMA|nr:small ribosomal subunit assembling AARP2 protein, putative [Plasmodium malariae]SBT87125.1 small ribosomal subunit assembling AARP2 protein, putative [Plasmodium malariae]